MNTIQFNDESNLSIKKLSGPINMLQVNHPLQFIGDKRFQMIVTRAKEKTRIAPTFPRPATSSERSSWSSASIVSSIDLRSPEPNSPKEVDQSLQTKDQESKYRRLLIGLCILLVVLILIGIILGIVLPLTLSKNSVTQSSSLPTATTSI